MGSGSQVSRAPPHDPVTMHMPRLVDSQLRDLLTGLAAVNIEGRAASVGPGPRAS